MFQCKFKSMYNYWGFLPTGPELTGFFSLSKTNLLVSVTGWCITMHVFVTWAAVVSNCKRVYFSLVKYQSSPPHNMCVCVCVCVWGWGWLTLYFTT